MFEKKVKEEVEEVRELTGGWLGGFTEPRSEVFPCQSHRAVKEALKVSELNKTESKRVSGKLGR